MKYLNLTGLVLVVALLNGCATVTTGSNQSITIETSPPGASCKMLRDNETIGVVNPTPGSVTIGKDKDVVNVSCELSGYQTTTYSFKSTFQGATLGNILLGGGVGIIIDVASGAANIYPSSISIRLQPSEFANQQERDAYFDKQVAELNENTDKIAQGQGYACNTSGCKNKLAALNKQRAEELAGIESARIGAKVRNN